MSTYSDDKIIYLGGSHEIDEKICIQVTNAEAGPLRCSHEEEDDRIMFHLSRGVKVGIFRSIAIASPDTDIFVCSIHNYRQLMYFDLHHLWFIEGKSASRLIIPAHETAAVVDPDVFEILPAAHASTGCDSTSKVGSKDAAKGVWTRTFVIIWEKRTNQSDDWRC